MSISTSIQLVNAKDPKFLAATLDEDKKEEWIDENGNFIGAIIERDDDREPCVEETDDEYGGFLIDISKLPANATHIWVYRS